MNQLQILRQMTGEERIKQAICLSELTRELAMENIRKNLGQKATKKRIIKELTKRMYDK